MIGVSGRREERPPVGAAILEVAGVSKSFRGLDALTDVSFAMQDGEILGLIGPNGAGKTTLFNVISGRYHPNSGRIQFQGSDVTRWSPHRVAKHGLVRTFQLPKLFDALSVIDTVLIGCSNITRQSLLRALATGVGTGSRMRSARRQAETALEKVGLSDLADEQCGDLSHGRKRLIGLALALATEPHLLMLDEPLSGLTDEEIELVIELVVEIRGRGIGVLIVEHNVDAVMGLCDRIVVLNFGRVLAEGTPAAVQSNPLVIDAYLGTE